MVSTSNTSNSSTTTTILYIKDELGEEASNGETEGENDEAGSRLIVAIMALVTFIIFLCI